MEISFKYILIKLQLFLPVILTFLFISGGSEKKVEINNKEINIENRIRILVGVVISIHYIHKTLKYEGLFQEVSRLSEENEKIKAEIESLKNLNNQ